MDTYINEVIKFGFSPRVDRLHSVIYYGCDIHFNIDRENLLIENFLNLIFKSEYIKKKYGLK